MDIEELVEELTGLLGEYYDMDEIELVPQEDGRLIVFEDGLILLVCVPSSNGLWNIEIDKEIPYDLRDDIELQDFVEEIA